MDDEQHQKGAYQTPGPIGGALILRSVDRGGPRRCSHSGEKVHRGQGQGADHHALVVGKEEGNGEEGRRHCRDQRDPQREVEAPSSRRDDPTLRGEAEKCRSRRERDEEESDPARGGYDHVETGGNIEGVISPRQLAVGREREENCLNEGLSEDMEKDPQHDQTGGAMTAGGGICEEEEQADDDTKGETASKGEIRHPDDLGPVVEEDRATSEQLG